MDGPSDRQIVAPWTAGQRFHSIALGDIVIRTFVTKTFRRWYRGTALSERELCGAVTEMAAGLVDTNLGSSLFKKRLGIPGRGKRGGARVLVGTKLTDRWFFLFGFEKNERSTIDARELAALQKLANTLLKLDPERLAIELSSGALTEICHETKPRTH